MDALAGRLAALLAVTGSLCPNCGQGALFFTGEEYRLQNHFDGWEQFGVIFPAEVRAMYPEDTATALFQCDFCDFGTFVPALEGCGSYYEAITGQSYYNSHRPEFDLALSHLSGLQGHLLEIGGGAGDFLRFAHTKLRGVTFHEVDPNPRTQNVLAGLAAIHADMETVPEQVDAICVFQVLEHMGDPFAFIEQCRNRLRPGGQLLVSVPDFDGPIRFSCDSHTETPPHHLCRWNGRSLSYLFEERGFQIQCNKRIPLQMSMFSQYSSPIVYHLLHSFSLDKVKALSKAGAALEWFLRVLHLQTLPFSHYDRFVCAKRL